MRSALLPLLVTALAAVPASAQAPTSSAILAGSHSLQEAAYATMVDRRPPGGTALLAPEPLGPRRASATGEVNAMRLDRPPIGTGGARASTGRQALYGALYGAGVGLVAGALLDAGGYSAGGEDDEEGGSTIWVMVPLGAAAGALIAVLL